MNLNQLYIAFYVVSAFSFLCVTFVMCTIKRYGSASISSRLISYLHFTLLLQNIATLPYVYNGNSAICQIMGFLRYYSGLANIVIVGLMVQTYKFLFLEDVYHLSPRIDKYAEYVVFIFPLITVLPFCMNMYATTDLTWCVEPLETGFDYLWFWVAFYFWSTTIIIYSAFSLFNTVWTVYNTDRVLGRKLVKTVGFYVVISLVVWVFLTISSFNLINNVWNFLIVDISGIVYFLLFLTEKKALKLLEFQTRTTANINTTTESLYNRSTMATNSLDVTVDSNGHPHSSTNKMMFSWEIDDEVRSHSQASRTTSSDSNFTGNRPSSWRTSITSHNRGSVASIPNPIQRGSVCVTVESGGGSNL